MKFIRIYNLAKYLLIPKYQLEYFMHDARSNKEKL